MLTRQVCVWDGWSREKYKGGNIAFNAAEVRLFLSQKLCKWVEPWLVCLFLSPFSLPLLYLSFHQSLSFSVSLAFCFRATLWVCIHYVYSFWAMRATQVESNGKKPISSSCDKLLFTVSLSFLLSCTVVLLHPQPWWPAYRKESSGRKTDTDE